MENYQVSFSRPGYAEVSLQAGMETQRPFPFAHYICDAISTYLLDLVLEVLALNEVGDLIVVLVVLALLTLGHGLVALGKLAQGGKGVRAELVEDTGDKLGELLVLTVAVDGKGVGGDRGVDCVLRILASPHRPACQDYSFQHVGTYPWGR